MDFIEELEVLAARIPKLREHLQTEEATKNALVMPFIGILGYDIFNPTEVIPEFTCDVGIKKGEKVDYAIKKDEKIIILFECKKCGTDLDLAHASQLYRYFSVTDARIAILTNGIIYRFFTDLEAPNRMDSKPFMEFDLLDLQPSLVAELKKLTKPSFDLDEMITSAEELKYTREIRGILVEQLSSPSEDFVRFFAAQLYTGKLTQAIRDRFTEITKRALHQFINERINARLKTALAGPELSVSEESQGQVQPTGVVSDDDAEKIVTTEKELEGFYIVKGILREVVEPDRVAARDTQSYFGILLDDNNRKPICRLHFNRSQKYLGIIDENKKEDRIPIDRLQEIYQYADRLKATVGYYEKSESDQEKGSV